MKNKLIIIGGYCGAGKSTFARKLSRFLEVPCFIKDSIKETMGDSFGGDWSPETCKKASAVTFDLMMHIAESFLQVGKPCILEANFKLSEEQVINGLLEKYSAEGLTFIFDGDLDVIYDRYFLREVSGERHWAHLVEGESRNSFKEGQRKGRLTEVAIGHVIRVDASSFAQIDYEDLYSQAKKWMGLF